MPLAIVLGVVALAVCATLVLVRFDHRVLLLAGAFLLAVLVTLSLAGRMSLANTMAFVVYVLLALGVLASLVRVSLNARRSRHTKTTPAELDGSLPKRPRPSRRA